MLLGKKGMQPGAPMFVRIFKEESELEVWKQRDDGRFYHFKTYPICTWSGDLGPKLQQGDRQAPEGFYTISKPQMNPNSSFHLAFNLGYPNAFDKAHGRTGDALMVHGKCKSAGCYAMTDALIEEIYALARETFDAGHSAFPVHAYPFRMTDANMERHKTSKWAGFWKVLKEGHDHFEATRVPPPVVVCGKQYRVNARPLQNVSMRIDPAGQCPALERLPVEPFTPPADQQVADARIVAPGPKMRSMASAGSAVGATGSTSAAGGEAGNSGGSGMASVLRGLTGSPAISFGLGATNN
ncbi:MAG: murein L,D-transpeptidase family protein [Hyphomicrobiaceae bacterium]|nr:murein L,D-transpeptidase family protein [Hyphomicrobiaceae bacterium]